MKKAISLILAVIMAFSFSVVSFGAEKTEFLNGEVTVTFPEGFYATWEGMPDDAEFFQYYEATTEEIMENLDGAKAYFFEEDYIHQVFFYIEKCDYLDYNDMTEEEIEEYFKYDEEDAVLRGTKVLKMEKAFINGTMFLKEAFDVDGVSSYIMYDTVYKGFDIQLYGIAREGGITPEYESILEEFLENIVFNEEEPAVTEAFEHTVQGIGTKITVPKGWSIIGESNNSIKIGPNDENSTALILYSVQDLWKDHTSDDDKKYVSRSFYNEEFALYTEESFSEMVKESGFEETLSSAGFKINDEYFRKNEIGERVYFIGNISYYGNLEGYVAITIEMGVMHGFIIISSNMEEHDPIMRTIIETAVYPEIPDEGGDKADSKITPKYVVTVLMGAGVIAAMLIVAAIIKKTTKSKKEEKSSEELLTKQNSEEPVKFCSQCGAQIDTDDEFCRLCGAKIKR